MNYPFGSGKIPLYRGGDKTVIVCRAFKATWEMRKYQIQYHAQSFIVHQVVLWERYLEGGEEYQAFATRQ